MHLTQLEIKQLHWTSFRKGNLDIKGKTKNIHSSMSKQDWETQPAFQKVKQQFSFYLGINTMAFGSLFRTWKPLEFTTRSSEIKSSCHLQIKIMSKA